MLAEVVNDDGSVARTPQLMSFADQHGLAVLTIEQLLDYRQAKDGAAAAP